MRMDKLVGYIVIGILAICKLLITGVCLAIGFKIGGVIVAETEKRMARRPVVA
jgi:hypothetical protein